MPTIPPATAGPPARQLHQHRQMAESFGLDPERYDRSRPRYPEALVRAIVAASPGPDVLDVGCGTGISARQFQAAGCRVLGIDVDERMADFARMRGLEVEVAAFEAWDPAGRDFDTVIAGQTWHWVDPVAGAIKAAEVLRPGGRLALFWNMFRPSPVLSEAFSTVYRRVMPDLPYQPWATPDPGGGSEFFTRPADGIRAAGAFTDPEQWQFEWERSYTRDEWLDQLPTAGGHNRLPAATLEQLLEGVGDAIDALAGSFTMRYDAVVLTTVLSNSEYSPTH